MKKLIVAIVAAAAVAAMAALDFRGANATAIVPTASIAQGATNTTVFAAKPMKGLSEMLVASPAAYGRTALDVTLYATNLVSGGWSPFATATYTSTNAAVFRLAFPGEYMTKDAKLEISSQGAASTVSAVLLSY